MLRKMLDKIEPLFKPGGKLAKLYPLYEANDTFLYTPGEVTRGTTAIRDAIDLKRMMSIVIVALLPCIFMALYNTGYQAQKIIANGHPVAASPSVGDGLWSGNWRTDLLARTGILKPAEADSTSDSEGATASEGTTASGGATYTCDDPGGFFSFGSMLGCLFHGALFFLPVYIVTMIAGGLGELIFSIVRKHEINEGFLVTGMLFPLTLPPTIPLWQVALGILFGVVIGKEIFGGTGRNFLNPALTARAFLYFAHAKSVTGDSVWNAVDGFSAPTVLGRLGSATEGTIGSVVSEMHSSWWDFFVGNVHGSMGETSALFCLIGAAVLIATRVGSWRIMAGALIGMTGFSLLLWAMFGDSSPSSTALPYWHLVIGGFAFGTVFMATDPVSASMTLRGKWFYGALIGFMTVLVRAVNPAYPEGIMLAILFANVCAPLIDYFVVQSNVKRRAARYGA